MVVYVIDSSVVFLRKIHGNAVTIPEVVEEVKDEESKLYFSLHDVRVEEASSKNVERVVEVAKKTGDVHKLSNTDVKLIAKALDELERGEKVVIVSDDYSIQNIAKLLGIEIETVVHPGISKAFKWVKVCRGCGRRLTADVCPVCGSEAVLRRVKSEKTRRSGSKGKKVKGEGPDDGGDS
ncbi:NOB1 family endonuclease [Archaeoglobus veneficus]|uniref:NOB1 family endonuclease n=1 Tax=Archaeoglobus veneficus TaxID=58290 RepID=UPI0022B2A2D2|nr:ribonuclease VapC [Archaeoglobus veneficus]